jgi:hypothetical protein
MPATLGSLAALRLLLPVAASSLYARGARYPVGRLPTANEAREPRIAMRAVGQAAVATAIGTQSVTCDRRSRLCGQADGEALHA